VQRQKSGRDTHRVGVVGIYRDRTEADLRSGPSRRDEVGPRVAGCEVARGPQGLDAVALGENRQRREFVGACERVDTEIDLHAYSCDWMPHEGNPPVTGGKVDAMPIPLTSKSFVPSFCMVEPVECTACLRGIKAPFHRTVKSRTIPRWRAACLYRGVLKFDTSTSMRGSRPPSRR